MVTDPRDVRRKAIHLSFRHDVAVTWTCIAHGVIWNGPEADTEAGALVAALEDVSREGSE